jgi:hypothetical protein
VAEYETGGLFWLFLATVAKEFVLATELQNNYVLATVLQNHSYQGIPNKRKQRLKMCMSLVNFCGWKSVYFDNNKTTISYYIILC